MQLRYRNGAPLYGKTLQTVLAQAALPGDRRPPKPGSRVDADGSRLPAAPDGADLMAAPAPDEVYRGVTRFFSVVIIGFGIAIVVVTLANGGGVTSFGLLIGLVFTASAPAGSTCAMRRLRER